MASWGLKTSWSVSDLSAPSLFYWVALYPLVGSLGKYLDIDDAEGESRAVSLQGYL